MYVLFDIEKSLNNLMNPLKEFMTNHGDNPFLWFAIVIGGFLLFRWIYGSLQKEK